MSSFSTPAFTCCDLCDGNEAKLADGSMHVLPPVFVHFGQSVRFSGPAYTVKVFEDNVLVRAVLEQAGEGRVLVVDGGASMRCALVGGMLGVLAEKNGWSGIVVHGCVRDSVELNACRIGIRALGTHPQRSIRKGMGDQRIRINIAGVAVSPGDWIYADEDGIVVANQQLL